MSSPFGTILRPFSYAPANPLRRSTYLRFYHATLLRNSSSETASESLWSSGTVAQRLKELKALRPVNEQRGAFPSSLYPRLKTKRNVEKITTRQFRQRFGLLDHRQTLDTNFPTFILYGKVASVRTHGKKLVFFDLVYDDTAVQIMVNLGRLEKKGYLSSSQLNRFQREIKAGDFYQCVGIPVRTNAGELTLSAMDMLPEQLSPSLHTIPGEITDEGTLARLPQLELLTRRKKRDLIRLRHHIERTMQLHLNGKGFIKVTTPILASDTGGAAARPFETFANEFSDNPLRLRIAQELALKKLVAADLGAVYEIGPNFRNEGLDATHNPEFTTCEFYRPYTSIESLLRRTEELLQDLHASCDSVIDSLPSLEEDFAKLSHYFGRGKGFKRLSFLPTLMDSILPVDPHYRLPKFLSDDSVPELLPLFERFHIAIPANPTMARLLDSLASHLIEPQCQEPTFITDYPAIMSPLAKSYIDEETGHEVSARAELFIHGTEFANMYEEENDPFLQAKKFYFQAQSEQNTQPLDLPALDLDPVAQLEAIKKELTPGQRYFVRVLEMGLPPTGGWGCGIDRLVMLFGGAKRIHDVLPFGNLRNVIAMGTDPIADRLARTEISNAKGAEERLQASMSRDHL